jgi:DNA replication and repair protein RecF
LGGRSAGMYGSRAQQRSVVLALRLAESDLLQARTGESPILLLDDLFSELDPARREATAQALTETIAAGGQVLVTTADAGTVPRGLGESGTVYRISEGAVERRE